MITAFLYGQPSWAMALVIVGLTVAYAIAGLFLTHRFMPSFVRAKHNDITGYISAMIGVVYAVILAFLAIAVWEAFGKAEAVVQHEASAVADVWVDSRPYPIEMERAIRKHVEDYLTAVVNEEWESQKTLKMSAKAWFAIESLHRIVLDFNPQTTGQQAAHAEVLRKINTVLEDRRHRIFINEGAVNAEVWAVILIGSGLVIASTWLFNAENVRAQVLMMGMLGAAIGLVLFLILATDQPFRGGISVGSDPYARVLRTLKRLAAEQPPVDAPEERRRR